MVKHLKIIIFKTDWPVLLKVGIQHRAFEYYQVNDDPRLRFELFTQRSTLVPYAFVWWIIQKLLSGWLGRAMSLSSFQYRGILS